MKDEIEREARRKVVHKEDEGRKRVKSLGKVVHKAYEGRKRVKKASEGRS
ncbi:hypothetical protein ACTHO5_14835 [Cytobacillus praedii]